MSQYILIGVEETNMRITKEWWKAAAIRAIKTIAQSAVSLIPASVMITEVDWKVVVGTALLAGVVSMLTSVAGLPEVES